ncbi:hypothetical protein ACFL3V_00010 [Nanoarchaeota archaeon]
MKAAKIIFITALLLLVTACSSKPDLEPSIGEYELQREYPFGTDNSRYAAEYNKGKDVIFIEFWYANKMPDADTGEQAFRQRFFDENDKCRVHLLQCDTMQDMTIADRPVIFAKLPNPDYNGFFSWCGRQHISVSIPIWENVTFSRQFVSNMLSNCEE